MRPSRLLPLILARKHTVMPRPAKFQPREVTPEEAAALAALSARGEWDRREKHREKVTGEIVELVERWQNAKRQREATCALPMPDPCTWGAR